MALIQCPECKKEVSDKAKNCPNCAYPFIEQTRKTWKATRLICVGVGTLGVLLMIHGESAKNSTAFEVGLLLLFLGVGGVIVSKIWVWWQHG
jgi:predicted nucleic acid-binding Zn ribbon protein